MKKKQSSGKVAILVTDGFEQVELTQPRAFLEKNGYETEIVSPKRKKVKAVIHDKPGKILSVNAPLSRAKASDYDALLLPGGVMNPDSLRLEPRAVQFVKGFFKAGKPVAAICHGPIMLIEAGVVKGRRMTSFPSDKDGPLKRGRPGGANKRVIVDGDLVTSRKPADIPAFNSRMLKAFGSRKKNRA